MTKGVLSIFPWLLLSMGSVEAVMVYFKGKDVKGGYYLVPEKIPEDGTRLWVAVDVHGAGLLRGDRECGETARGLWNAVAGMACGVITSGVPFAEENIHTATMPSQRDFLRASFRAMLRARILENKLSSLYKAGKIVGGVYLGRGQEAVSATLGTSLIQGKDCFAPLIRDQAGRTAFGESMLDCTRTYLGSVKGPMRGRDGNIHRGRPEMGMPAMISHLGAQVPLIAGMLFAKRMKGTLEGCVGATTVGDGATSTGAFHEGVNLAAVENLPMVVVVANNQFAYSTPNHRQFACLDLVERARGYGIGGHSVDGTDLLACAEVIGGAVRKAREGEGPQMVVAHLLRLSGHGEHDDGSYVPDSAKDGHYGRDCIEVAMRQLAEGGHTTMDEILTWQEEAAEEVQRAVAQAQQEPVPDPYREDWTALSTKFPLTGT